MRQPPEKLFTGASSCSGRKPRPSSSACARERASKPPASLQMHVRLGDGVAVFGPRPPPARQTRCHQRHVAVEHEVGGASSVSGMILRDLAQPLARRHLHVAGIGVQPAGEQGEQAGLARAVAPDQAHLLAGVEGDIGILQHHLGTPRRSVRFFSVIMNSGRGGRERQQCARSSSSTWSSPALVGSQTTVQRGKGGSKWARSWPISSTSTPRGEVRRRTASRRRMKSMPSAPPARASAARRGTRPAARHRCAVDVGRVAQDQVVAPAPPPGRRPGAAA
jgi:hypothetical protein